MPHRDRPNVILINCDDLGYGDLGCYGSTVNATPNLDRMAAEGVRLTDFYMASPVCSPSRGGMLTGCYPPRIGFGQFEGRPVLFPGDPVGLSTGEVTIASLLKGQGYATRLVGKWHCGDQPEFLPTRHGFDGYFGLPYSNDMGRQVGPPKDYPPLPLLLDEQVIQQQPDQTALTERYVDDCVRFIRANRDRPFFLYLAHMYVHLPIYVPMRFLAESANGPYGAAVASIDWSVGVILHELATLGLDEDTLVIFTSDNGARGTHGGSNGPLRGAKHTTWEGGQRVPCIVRMPGRIPGGRVSGEIAASIDFLPTIARLAGAAPPGDRVIDGLDLTAFLTESAPSPRDRFFYYAQDDLEAVRSGRWKLHLSKKRQGVTELYDLERDVGETTNVADAHPQVVERIKGIAAVCRQELGDARLGITGAGCRPAARVPQGRTLTRYDPSHPYFAAEYDLPDRG